MATPPHVPARFPIAERISQLLVQELGQGIDARRMLNDPLYARDVLLVCEAHPGSELALMAMRFRRAPAFRMRDAAPTTQPGAPSTGFGSAGPGRGADTDLPPLAPPAAHRRAWFSPARWLGR